MAKGDVKKVRMQKHGFFRTFQGVVFSDQEAAQDPHDAHEDDSGPNSLKLEPFLNTSHDEGHRDVHGPTKFVPIAQLSACRLSEFWSNRVASQRRQRACTGGGAPSGDAAPAREPGEESACGGGAKR